jgi:hypothetical protein
VHFLESLTFISKIQDAIVEEFGAALRMLFGEVGETTGKFVAGFRHGLPPTGDFVQIVFFADAQCDRPVNPEKLLLQIAGFGIKWRAQIRWYLT